MEATFIQQEGKIMGYNGLAQSEMKAATVTLTNGKEVLAKLYHGDLQPIRYANRTQADDAVARLGAGWAVWQGTGRPFYVVKVAN